MAFIFKYALGLTQPDFKRVITTGNAPKEEHPGMSGPLPDRSFWDWKSISSSATFLKGRAHPLPLNDPELRSGLPEDVVLAYTT